MSTEQEAWKGYSGAPEVGAVIARIDDIPDPGTFCLELDGYPILLARLGDAVNAFVNACPHQFLPLNYRGEKLLSADGRTLRCTNHSAGFDAGSGEGVEGLGLGCALDRIPVSVTPEGRVKIG